MSKKFNIQLVIIDPQNSFMDIPEATLPVTGADKDMKRGAKLIDRIGKKLDDIHVTLDSHRIIDISHPAWWIDGNFNPPNPFTIITAQDIETGIWTTKNSKARTRTLKYARDLEATPNHYSICVWYPHCLIGTWGHNVQEDINKSLQNWSKKEDYLVDYVTKGSNPWVEHYGALMAEVPDPNDPSTGLNTDFLQMIAQADIIGVFGEASSHCVLKTVKQIEENIGIGHVKKFHLITDCMSPVGAVPNGPNFPQIAQDFLQEMKNKGMTLTTAENFLS